MFPVPPTKLERGTQAAPQAAKSEAEFDLSASVFPKLDFSKPSFSKATGAPTFRTSATPWRPAMQVLFQSRHPHAAELRDLTVRRVNFVLRRLRWMVPRAEVQLSDVNGPRGGLDKRCQIELRTDGAGSVVVTSLASDWRTALDNALARAARFLMRVWRRGGDSRRLRQRLLAHER